MHLCCCFDFGSLDQCDFINRENEQCITQCEYNIHSVYAVYSEESCTSDRCCVENMGDAEQENVEKTDAEGNKPDKLFTLKKWNAVAMWSWDVECDTCAICRVQVMDACLRCQAESKKDFYGKQDCVVVWGECNHSFHYCCMSLWVKQNNRCPLCQQEWSIQRMGK